MDGAFACPECGNELVLSGTSPGRQIRCGWGKTWGEVPFFPRALGSSRSRHSRGRKRKWPLWASGGLALAIALVVVLGTVVIVRIRGRVRAERALAERLASADAAEQAGRYDEAFLTVEAAIEEAG